ncbi:MAG: phage portal protein, partial [Smithella sp.]
IKFLTKDIPYEFIKFMTDLLREQIHIQSHVPDFTSDKMAGASGIAIQRLLFDFENVVSSAEADFDVGLNERIDLISTIYALTNVAQGSSSEIVITHKRNVPLNLKEFADTAMVMKNAGFSRYLIADIMPDDIIPDVEEELARQDADNEALMGDIETQNYDNLNADPNADNNVDETNQIEEE